MTDTAADVLGNGHVASHGPPIGAPARPVIQIVPLKGLPVVAVVLGFLDRFDRL